MKYKSVSPNVVTLPSGMRIESSRSSAPGLLVRVQGLQLSATLPDAFPELRQSRLECRYLALLSFYDFVKKSSVWKRMHSVSESEAEMLTQFTRLWNMRTLRDDRNPM